ncbi:MAG: hypothetical protein EZS28_005128 [Streblomastix strix]|uniref:Uncharacterized protein n=1 Tax=Streblomastix strix TaxID=222440 RepID=A0A5J4WXQ2_9EUKA|nr:MAG: hypothetical protein EZS28_005128 [Streblomastix strix]
MENKKCEVQEKLTIEVEKITANGTDNNGDDDQSEHAIEQNHFTNGNDGFREIDSGMQFQATVDREANPEIIISNSSANTPPNNVNRSDGLGGKG